MSYIFLLAYFTVIRACSSAPVKWSCDWLHLMLILKGAVHHLQMKPFNHPLHLENILSSEQLGNTETILLLHSFQVDLKLSLEKHYIFEGNKWK